MLSTQWMVVELVHSPHDEVRANTFSLAATVKISALKKWC